MTSVCASCRHHTISERVSTLIIALLCLHLCAFYLYFSISCSIFTLFSLYFYCVVARLIAPGVRLYGLENVHGFGHRLSPQLIMQDTFAALKLLEGVDAASLPRVGQHQLAVCPFVTLVLGEQYPGQMHSIFVKTCRKRMLRERI